jgi:hypothetical protein
VLWPRNSGKYLRSAEAIHVLKQYAQRFGTLEGQKLRQLVASAYQRVTADIHRDFAGGKESRLSSM